MLRLLPAWLGEWLAMTDWRKSGARGLKNALNGPPTAIQAQSSATIQAGEVVGVGIMRVLRAIKKAAPAFHRWLMKYSGTTMIIDNIEERRRWFNRSGIGVN